MLFGFFYGKYHLNQHSVVMKKEKNRNVTASYKSGKHNKIKIDPHDVYKEK
jgi:hypothetical protein